MSFTPLENAFFFFLLGIIIFAFGWLLRRGARRSYLTERAELRMAAGELGGLVSRGFSPEPCAGCGGVEMELITIGDSDVSAEYKCRACGVGGSLSASVDARAQARKSWEQYSTRRKAFEKGHRSIDPEDVVVRFRVWVRKA